MNSQSQVLKLKQSIQKNLLQVSLRGQQRAYNQIQEFISMNMLHLEYETQFLESINNQIIQNSQYMTDLPERLQLMDQRLELLNIINKNFQLQIDNDSQDQIRKDIIEYLNGPKNQIHIELVIRIIKTMGIRSNYIIGKVCQNIKHDKDSISNSRLLNLLYDLDQANIDDISVWNSLLKKLDLEINNLDANKLFKLFCILKSIGNKTKMIGNAKIRTKVNDLSASLSAVFVKKQSEFSINVQIALLYDIWKKMKMRDIDDQVLLEMLQQCVGMINQNPELLYQTNLIEISKLQSMMNNYRKQLDGETSTAENIYEYTVDELINQIRLNGQQLSSKVLIVQNILTEQFQGQYITNEKMLKMYYQILNEQLIDQFQLAMIVQTKRVNDKKLSHKFFGNVVNYMYDNLNRLDVFTFIKAVKILQSKIQIPQKIHDRIYQKMVRICSVSNRDDDQQQQHAVKQIYVALYDKLFISQQKTIEEDRLLQLVRENRQCLETKQIFEILGMVDLDVHYVQYFNQTFRKNMIEINMNKKLQIYELVSSILNTDEYQQIFFDDIIVQDLEEIIQTKQNQLSVKQICMLFNMFSLILDSKVKNGQTIIDIQQIQQLMLRKILAQKRIPIDDIRLLLQGKQYFDTLNTNLQPFIVKQLEYQSKIQVKSHDLLALDRIVQMISSRMLIIEDDKLKQTVKKLLANNSKYFSKQEMEKYLKLFIY